MNGKNKRFLETRWDKRQPARLEHIRAKRLKKQKGVRKRGD